MNQSEWLSKPASEWNVVDLKELEQAEEGVHLEFKKPSEFILKGQFSWDKFAEEISETVSAFLNSDGGILLIGVQTDQAVVDKKTEVLKPLDKWTGDQTFENLKIQLTASQVSDRIHSNVLPVPFGIQVKGIEIPVSIGATTVFVVTVPASSLGAHQSVRTRRYYRRTSDGDVPMLDYEIRDVNNRKAGPLLYLACAVSNNGKIFAEDEWKSSKVPTKEVAKDGQSFSQVDVIFATTNLGRGTANVVRFDVGLPKPWRVVHYSPEGTNVGAYWVPNNASHYLIGNRVTVYWKPGKCREVPTRLKNVVEQAVEWQTVIYNGNESPAHPIWPTAGRVVIGVLRLHLQIYGTDSTWWWLPWRIFTEGMPETRGAVLLRGVTGLFQVTNYEIDDVDWVGEAEDEQKFNMLNENFRVH